MTDTMLRAALVLAGAGYASALFLAGQAAGSPLSAGRGASLDRVPEPAIGVLLVGAGLALAIGGGSRGAALLAAAAGVVWIAGMAASSDDGSDPLRGPALASAMLLGPLLLALAVSLAGTGSRSGRRFMLSVILLALAVLVASLRLTTYDPFADPTCINCAHAGRPLLVVSLDQRLWLERAAAAITIVSGAGLVWVVLRRARATRRIRGSRLAAVAGCAMAGGAAAVDAALPYAPGPLAPSTGLVEPARLLGGLLLLGGLAWLVVDVVRIRLRMRRLADDIESAAGLGGFDNRLAGAIGDSSVLVGYWFENEGRHVAADGSPFATPPGAGEHAKVRIERDGQLIAAVWHRRGIEPRAIRNELTPSLLVALDNERLGAVSAANLGALQASRARLVAMQEEQRRQIERDLHDGLQQRLLAIVFDLRLARVAAERIGEVRRATWLAAAEAHSLSIVEDVRRLARGIYPAILVQAGLAAALESLGDESPIPITATVGASLRLPKPVETTVYQVVVDALAEAVRGGAEELSVVVEQAGEDLAIAIDHDGVTASVPVRLADLISAAGGRIAVSAAADRSGSRVRVALPCA